MRILLIFGVLSIALTAPAAAAPSPTVQCKFALPAEEIAHVAELPAGISKVLAPIADRGARYNATDSVDDPGLPFKRIIRAGHRGNLWFVWYEQGGIAYFHQVVAFRLAAPGTAPVTVANATLPVKWMWGGWQARVEPCRLIDDILAGRVPPYPEGVVPASSP